MKPAPAVALALTLALAASVGAQSAARRVWTGEEVGAARQIHLALDDTHVFLAETGSLTTIDRASGAATTTAVRTHDGDYLPVQSAVVHQGALWLSVGNGTRRSRPRLLELEGDRVHERAMLSAWACSLTSVGDALYWSDRQHLRRLVGGRVRVFATAPAGAYFASDCRTPLAVDDEHVFVVLGRASDPTAATPLLAYPRGGGPPVTLDPDVALQTPLRVEGALVLTHTSGAPRPMERFDLATHARTTLVSSLTVVAAATDGQGVVVADGNFFSGDAWALRRVDPTTGTVTTLHQGDRRLAHAVVADAHGALALVGAHPDGECTVTHHAIEPGDHTITRCAQPDLQLFAAP